MTSKKMKRMYGPKETPAPGQVPLKDPRVEAEVVAVVLASEKSFYLVDEVVTEEAFSDEIYRTIFKASSRLRRAQKSVDFPLLQFEIDKINPSVQLEDVAVELQATTVTEDTVVEDAKYLQVLAVRRALRDLLQKAIPMVESAEQDIDKTFVELMAAMYSIKHACDENHLHEFKDMLARSKQEWKDRKEGKEPNKGTMSGFPTLDEMTLGFRPGELTLIAGNTGHGKTALAINILSHMLLHEKRRIALVSLEMLNDKIFGRFTRGQFEKPVTTKDGVKMTDDQWEIVEKVFEQLGSEDYPLFIDDTPSMHVDVLRSKMLYLVKHHGVTDFFLDYTQLMQGEGGNRQEEVAYVVESLRAMAKEFKVSVIALAQFNRADVREQYLRMPKLYNMRESGSLEMTADVVISIMRPELTVDGLSIGGIPLKGRAILSVLKNREGNRKHIDMLFDGERTKFMELPENMPSLVNAVLKTGGRADIETSGGASTGTASSGTAASGGASSSSGYTPYGQGGGQANGSYGAGQASLPEMKRKKYIDDEDMALEV